MRIRNKAIAVLTALALCQVPIGVNAEVSSNSVISLDEITLNIGSQTTISPTLSSALTFSYASDNVSVVTVDQAGNLTAVSEGSAQITATAYKNGQEVAVEQKTVLVTAPEFTTQTPVITTDPTATPTATPEPTPVPSEYTTFTFNSDSIDVREGEYNGYAISGTQLTINAAGFYCINGNCEDGSVTVKKGTTGVTIVIEDLSLTYASSSAITFNKDTEVVLEVKGTNNLADSSYNNDENHPDNLIAENAVLKAKAGGTLRIQGVGTLNIDADGKNGIKANAGLVIDGPEINIDSVDNGISNESIVTIDSGTLNITAGGDGIKSAVDTDATGTVIINGGDITIDATGDGIQATQLIEINGGNFDITTYGGSDAVYNGDDVSYPSAKGIKASGSYVTTDSSGNEVEVDATDCTLNITGGTFFLDCADDGIHSDKDVTITGGDIVISTGDDGIHANYVNTIGTNGGSDDDLTILIEESIEAIEGAVVNMHSGAVTAYADDDGVNAANADLGNYSFAINVTGGNHLISCNAGDGFDSNKNLTFTGGTTVVCGSAGLGEGNPLDCDGTLSITNATVLGIGTGNMAAVPSSGIYVVYGSSSGGSRPGGSSGSTSVSITDGNTVSITDSSSNQLFSATAKWNKTNSSCKATYVIFASPNLTKSSTYNLNVNGTKVTSATATGTQSVTSMSVLADNFTITDQEGNIISSAAMEVSYTYSVADTLVAIVSNNKIKGVAAGNTTLTVTAWIADVEIDSVEVDVTVSQTINGDVNGDGRVTLNDAQLTLKAALNIINLTDEQSNASDYDGNGAIELSDAQQILRKALNII